MIELAPAIFFFWLGMLVQAFLLLRGRITKRDILWIAAISLLAFAFLVLAKYFMERRYYSDQRDIIASFVFFGALFAYIFKGRILPYVDEKVMLIWNLIFLYSFLEILTDFPAVFILVLIPTAFTFLNAYADWRLKTYPKVILYAWFLIMIVLVAARQFFVGDRVFTGELALNFTQSVTAKVSEVGLILAGMAFLYIVSHAWYVYRLIPIPGRHQSWEERKEQWKDDIVLAASRFSGHQLLPARATLIILILGGALLLNYQFRLLPDWLLLSAVLSLASVLTGKITPQDA